MQLFVIHLNTSIRGNLGPPYLDRFVPFFLAFLRPFLVRRRAPGGLGFVLGAILVLDLRCAGRVSPSGSRGGGGGNGNSSPYGLSLIE